MPFIFTKTKIPDIVLIEPKIFSDDRGFFAEIFKSTDFKKNGIREDFVQVNHSKSGKDVLRGLHYQKHPQAQGKLMRALAGEIYDVAVDIRQGSPTFGQWVASVLSSENKRMLYVPAGFAHGFCVTSAEAEIFYMTTAEYAPECEAGVRWDDPDLRIGWPVARPRLSNRDLAWPWLKDADNNFRFGDEIR